MFKSVQRTDKMKITQGVRCLTTVSSFAAKREELHAKSDFLDLLVTFGAMPKVTKKNRSYKEIAERSPLFLLVS